jgi:hypothetical protein
MSFMDRMIRAFCGASILLIAQAVPAFAEKVTLACSLGTGFITTYWTIDTVAKTMKEQSGTYPAQITDDAVSWYSQKMTNTYNRQTAQISGWMSFNWETHQMEPTPCVRAPPAPF